MDMVGMMAVAAASQGLLLATAIASVRTSDRRPNILLATLVFTLSTYLWLFFAARAGVGIDYRLYTLGHVQLTIGPLLFLYSRTLSRPSIPLLKRSLLHFVPAPVAIALSLTWMPFGAVDGNLYITAMDKVSAYSIYGVLCSVYLIGYCIASINILDRHRENIRNRFSATETISLKWLRNLVHVIGIFAVLRALADISIGLLGAAFEFRQIVIMSGGIVLLFYITVFGVRQPIIFSGREGQGAAGQDDAKTGQAGDGDMVEPAKAKYRHSGVSEDRARHTLERLDRVMAEQVLYLDNNLHLSDLARKVGVIPEELSETLNLYARKNFYEYINDLRVDHAARMLASDDYRKMPLIDLAFESGFNSKSTFYKQFRLKFGETPSAFRRRLGKQEDLGTSDSSVSP